MGRFAIPEKWPFHGIEIAMSGKCARREPLPGVDSRAHVLDGSRRDRGWDSIRGGDLLTMFFSDLFSPRRIISVAAGQGACSLRNPDTQYYDRQHGEELYRFQKIPLARTRGSGEACGIDCGSRGEGGTPGREAARDRKASVGRSNGRRDPGSGGRPVPAGKKGGGSSPVIPRPGPSR